MRKLLYGFLFLSSLTYGQEAPTSTSDLSILSLASDHLDEGKLSASDSLLQRVELDGSKSDEVHFKYHEIKGNLEFSRHDLHSAQEHFQEALKYARLQDDSLKLVKAYSGMGNLHNLKAMHQDAIAYYDSAMEHLPGGEQRTYHGLLINKATSLQALGRYAETIDHLEKARSYFEKIGDTKTQATCENNIGEVYRNHLEDLDKAIKHYKIALALNESNKSLAGQARNHHNLGAAYLDQKNFEAAEAQLKEALSFRQKAEDLGGIATTYNLMGSLYLQKEDFSKAQDYLSRSLEISKTYGIAPGIYHNNLMLSKLYLRQKNYPEALARINKAVELADQSGDIRLQSEAQLVVYKAYRQSGQFEKALLALEVHEDLKDSISQLKNEQQINALRSKFETNLAEAENALLRSRQQSQSELVSRQKILLIASLCLVGLVMAGGIILGNALRQRNRAYRLEQERKQELNRQYALLKQKEAQLSSANDLKNKILSVLGHDLRSPLASISTLLNIITSQKLSHEELQELFTRLQKDVNVSLATLQEILTWSRMQMDERGKLIEESKVRELMRETIELYKNRLIDKQVDVNLNVDPDLSLYADRNQMRSVLGNLLSNAIKFSPAKGSITLSANTSENDILMVIEDEGEGIPEDVLANLNIRQELITADGTNGEKGSGIGLRIVQDFVRAHQGKLHFANREGGGTRIEVRMPNLPQAVTETISEDQNQWS